MARRAAPQFLFENFGSRGDIVPMLSIAAEMTRRAYRCHLLANEHFRTEATQHGISFSGTTAQRTNSEGPARHDVGDYVYRTFDGVRAHFRQPGGFDASTVVVNTDVWAASEPFAEAQRLRTVRLHLFPIRIRSLVSPPWPLGARAQGPQGEAFRKLTLPALYRAADTHPKLLAVINGARAQVGLCPVDTAAYERSHVVAQAALFPDWFGMPAEDWPEMECLGFPLPTSQEPLPARLLSFLARHPRPLVFTPGTSVDQAQPFFDAAADCCAKLGMPGLFLSPFLRPERQKLGPDIEHFEHIELEGVLRHTALLVHHGGLGTTARALQAGVPQIISPMGFDQPDNGHRVELLGAGRVIPRARLTGAALAALVEELLGNAAVASSLCRYRAALASPQAIERCADLLERVARATPLLEGVGRATPLLPDALPEGDKPWPRPKEHSRTTGALSRS